MGSGMTRSTTHLTREAACEALGVSPETLAHIERAGGLVAEADSIDPLALAAAAVRFGLAQSEAADRKVASVATSLSEVRPALERLADLPGRAALEGEGHDKAMIEVAAFFTAFAEAMNRATSALTADEEAGGEPA
jgi:transcriptional regulator with XRE-family HTH domain